MRWKGEGCRGRLHVSDQVDWGTFVRRTGHEVSAMYTIRSEDEE